MTIDDHDDFFVEDISIQKSKKRIKGGVKGKTKEREIVKILNDRFQTILKKNPDWGSFNRTVGSGNRQSQANLSKQAKEIYAGDIAGPGFFKFSIENKAGYPIELASAFTKGNKLIDSFLVQAKKDADSVGKRPLMIWKKDYCDRLAFFIPVSNEIDHFTYYLKYRGWYAVELTKFLEFDDDFFFS